MRSAWPVADVDLHLDAVIFDFDGVIVESADIKTSVFRALFSRHAEHLDEIIALHERHAGLSRLVKFDMIHRDILKAPLSPEAKADLASRFEALVVEQVIACPMVPGAKEVLEFLRGRVPTAVASGTPDVELKDIVARRGLTAYFDEVHGSPRGKAEIIGDLLARRSWSAAKVVMIGDAMADYEAAAEHGLNFIGRAPSGRRSPFPTGTRLVADLSGLISAMAPLQSMAPTRDVAE